MCSQSSRRIEILKTQDFISMDAEIYNLMQWKSKNHVSDKTYTKLSKILFANDSAKLPQLWRIVSLQNIMAKKFPVLQNGRGAYVDATLKITGYLTNMFKKNPSEFPKNKKLRIKLSGDGSRVANCTLFNFSFCLMDFAKCTTASGSYSLGIFEVEKENYNQLKECLKEVVENLRPFQYLDIVGERFIVEWFLGGDLKFLSTVLGLSTNFNNSLYPCAWCKCKRANFKDYNSTTVSIKDINKEARSLAEAAVSRENGYINEPIIDFIAFDHVIIDLLHLWLRITDVLLERLLNEVEYLDFLKTKKKPRCGVASSHPACDRLQRRPRAPSKTPPHWWRCWPASLDGIQPRRLCLLMNCIILAR